MDLESILIENYDQIINPDCKKAVLDFISNNESVLDMEIRFIKRLTKVADNILSQDPSSMSNLLGRLYHYHNEGISIIDKLDSNAYSQNCLEKMKSHLFSHRGNVARAISKALKGKSEKIDWDRRWYYSYIQSAEIAKNCDHNHSAYAYIYAGKAAKAISRKSIEPKKKIHWAVNAYKAYIKSACDCALLNPGQSANAYREAGYSAMFLFEKTNEDAIKNEAIRCFGLFVNYYERKQKNMHLVQKIKGIISNLEDKQI